MSEGDESGGKTIERAHTPYKEAEIGHAKCTTHYFSLVHIMACDNRSKPASCRLLREHGLFSLFGNPSESNIVIEKDGPNDKITLYNRVR